MAATWKKGLIESDSHTLLSDIGTNTHAQIDTHIADAPKHSVEHGIEFLIDGGGSAITTGIKGDLEVPFKCEIQSATLLADQVGSIVIDIWKDAYANYPPTVADTITAEAKPTISSNLKSQDNTLTGWTKTLNKGDTLRFNVDSCATITRVCLSLKINKVS